MRIRTLLCTATLVLALLAGCKHTASASGEIAYVSAPQALLRDKVSAVYTQVGTITNGERVEITAREKRFVKVKTGHGAEGWVELRYLVPAEIYDQFAELAKESRSAPAQGRAAARNDVNMHLTPSRGSAKLFQIKEGEPLEMIKRAIAPRNPPPQAPKPKTLLLAEKNRAREQAPQIVKPTAAAATPPKPAGEDGAPPPPPDPLEDWWLVRTANQRAGWVLARMLDVDVPLDVAQYAEGKRIIAAYVLTTVLDPESGKPDHQAAYYLVLMNENHDGQPQDFSSMRIFTWNLRRHRYETAYREHDLNGYLPATVSREDFGKAGVEPAFTIREKDDTGKLLKRKFRLEGVLVKRVYAPGEEPQAKPPAAAASSKRKRHLRHPRPRH